MPTGFDHSTELLGIYARGLVVALFFVSMPWLSVDAASPASPETTKETAATSVETGGGLERLAELNLLSQALVEKAARGDTPANEFRIEARMYRELLRRLMLDDRERTNDQRLPQDLLLDMVRMSALLHSAADCKTGLVITCPAELVLQLKSQQLRVEQGLEMTRLTRE